MGDERRRPLQCEGAVFFGHVVAGLSHELSNVFNIINEMAGLQLDIALGSGRESAPEMDRVAEIAGRIKTQVERGETFNQLLHSLAHSVDEANTAFDLTDTMDLAISLAARPARLMRVELAVHSLDLPLTMEGDPFALLLTIYRSIEAVLGAADSERRVEVRAGAHDNGARITITSEDPLPPGVVDRVAAATEAWRAAWGAVYTLDPSPPETHQRIILDIPTIAPAESAPDHAAPEDSHAT
jgi:signal transduction histidine kinase